MEKSGLQEKKTYLVHFFIVFIGEFPIFNFTYWIIILSIELGTLFCNLSELKALTYPNPRGQWSEKVHELTKPGKICYNPFVPSSKYSRKHCQKLKPQKTYIQKFSKLISNKTFQKFQKKKKKNNKNNVG